MTYQNDFIRHARQLRNKGAQMRQLHQIAKAGGLVVAGLSGLALVTGTGALIPLVVGASTFAGGLLSERKRTGKLQPLPWVSDDLGSIAARSLHELPGASLETQEHHYLGAEDKARYYLANFQGHRLTQLAHSLEPEQFEHIAINLVDHLVTAHQSALNHPELLSGALNLNFFDDAVNSLPKSVSETLPATAKSIGPETRIHALPTDAAEVTETDGPSYPANVVPFAQPEAHWENEPPTVQQLPQGQLTTGQPVAPVAPRREPVTAVSVLLASPFKSRAIFGGQRTGKSYLAAVATRKLAAKGINIFHINLASYGPEDGQYWQHAVMSVRCDLPNATAAEAIEKINQSMACFKQFFATPNSILVFDEIAYTGSTVNAYARHLEPLLKFFGDKVSTLSTTGQKRRQALWTLAPEMTAGDLTQDARAVKKLKLCLIAIAPTASADWQGQEITFDYELFESIKRNYGGVDMPPMTSELVGQDRIALINGQWVPIGTDANSLATVAPATPNAAPSAPVAPVEYVDDEDFDSEVANLATVQIAEQKGVYQVFLDWAKSRESIDFQSFQNANCFKPFGRGQNDWMTLVFKAGQEGWINEVEGQTGTFKYSGS